MFALFILSYYKYHAPGNTQFAEVKPQFNSENISFGGYISTPFFPMIYPDDLTFEQVINCKASACIIHLIFVDFQIAEESIVEVLRKQLLDHEYNIIYLLVCTQMNCINYFLFWKPKQFYDSNRKRLGIVGGITFRPPVVISSGPALYIKFFANIGSSFGYKAQYSFVRG